MALKVSKVVHVFTGQTEHKKSQFSFPCFHRFSKWEHNKPEVFRLLLKILAGSSDLSSYSAKSHFINRKIRNNVVSHLTDEKLNTSPIISYQNVKEI